MPAKKRTSAAPKTPVKKAKSTDDAESVTNTNAKEEMELGFDAGVDDKLLGSKLSGANKDYRIQLEAWLEKITTEPMLGGIKDREPLKIKKATVTGSGKKRKIEIDKDEDDGQLCGHKGVFDLTEYFTSMQEAGTYEAACNPFWADPRYTPTPTTPVNMKAMTALQQAMFPGAERPTLPMVIAVPSADFNPMEHLGSLQVVSPPEGWQCQLKACFEVLVAGGLTQEDANEWAASFLTTTFKFKILPTEDERFAEAKTLRKIFLKQANALSRTTLQAITDLIGLKLRKEIELSRTLTNADLLKLMKDLADGDDNDDASETYITNATMVWKDVLSRDENMSIALAADNHPKYSTPFDSVYKYANISAKARKNPERINWVVCATWDSVVSEEHDAKELSIRVLTNTVSGKGLIDLFLLKLDFRDYLLKEWCHEVHIETRYIEVYQKIFNTHAEYRATFGYINDGSTDTVDLTFTATWKPSACLVMRLIEAPT